MAPNLDNGCENCLPPALYPAEDDSMRQNHNTPTWIHLLAHPAEAALHTLMQLMSLRLSEAEWTSCYRRLSRLLDAKLPGLRDQDHWLERVVTRLRGAAPSALHQADHQRLAERLFVMGLP